MRAEVAPASVRAIVGADSGCFGKPWLDPCPVRDRAHISSIQDHSRTPFPHTVDVHLITIDVDQRTRRRIHTLVPFCGSRLIDHACHCQYQDKDGYCDKKTLEPAQYSVRRACFHLIPLRKSARQTQDAFMSARQVTHELKPIAEFDLLGWVAALAPALVLCARDARVLRREQPSLR